MLSSTMIVLKERSRILPVYLESILNLSIGGTILESLGSESPSAAVAAATLHVGKPEHGYCWVKPILSLLK